MNPKLLIGLLAITALAAGCGTKTDPTSDYKDLGDSVPVYDGKPHEQSMMPGNTFHAEVPSTMNFVEGQESSYPITVSSLLNGISFGLTASGLPAGVQLVQIDATHYLIKGTVPVGTTLGGQKGERLPIKISAVNAKGDEVQVRMFNGLLHTWDSAIALYATDQYPMVEGSSALSVNEGESLPISIVVKDIGSSGANVPTPYMAFKDDMVSGEVAFISAQPAFSLAEKPQALGDGRFKFSGRLDTKSLKLPSGRKDVTARLVIAFRSPSGLISADEIVDVKIVRSQPAPAAAPAPAPAPVAAPAPAPAAQPAQQLKASTPAIETPALKLVEQVAASAPALNEKPAEKPAAKAASAAKPVARVVPKSSAAKSKKAKAKKATPKAAQKESK